MINLMKATFLKMTMMMMMVNSVDVIATLKTDQQNKCANIYLIWLLVDLPSHFN